MADVYGTPTGTPPLSRGSSFQRMLELEKRYKLERLQSDHHQPDLSPSEPSEPGSPRAPIQLRRANSISQQQQDLMLKAVRRSIAPPPLSITIPPPNGDRKLNEAKSRQNVLQREPEPDLENVEPLQKSVKFLAPDSDEDEESDQSSICQSPSWEGYGQKKKEKKKEAERKRKAKEQKEQAEREAKAAKKRASSRLSKAAPLLGRQMPTVMERSNSAPLLESSNFRAANRVQQLPTVDDEHEYVRSLSHQNSPLWSSFTPDSTEMLDSSGKRFIGGLKLQQEREAALQHAIQSQFPFVNGGEPRQRMQKSYTTGPGMDMSAPVSGASSVRNDSRSSRESCPPSASRTPMLRHASAQQPVPKVSRGRDNNNHAVTSSYSNNDHTPEFYQTGDTSVSERDRNDGYVRHQRNQSTERALAGLLDEELTSKANASSSTRSSSQHTRSSSQSQDVKTATIKQGAHRGSAAKNSGYVDDGSVDQGDYFTYLDQPHSPSAAQVLSPSAGLPTPSKRSKANKAESTSSKATQESTAPKPTSINAGNGKTRSLKDVARAALHMAPSQTPVPTTKPTFKPPPYYLLRAKFSSSSSVPTVNTPPVAVQTSQPPKPAPTQATSASAATPNQPGSRVSEGSSSSSNYDDGSPLPSPVTTPDTSRPQSAKGFPMEHSTVPQSTVEECIVQDDARTLRQSSEAVGEESSSDVTPRLPQYDEGGNEMPPGDRWSRTALPMDIDFDDARSTASDYSDAREEPVKTASAPAQLQSGTDKRKKVQRFDEPGDSFGRSHLLRSRSDPDLTSKATESNSSDAQEPLIPRRSKAREQKQPAERPETASAEQQLGKQFGNSSAKEELQEPEQRKKKLRKQKSAPEPKPDKAVDADTEVVERATDKQNVTKASANVSLMSSRFMSPIGGFIPSYGFASNPLFVDFSELNKVGSTSEQATLPVKITATQITFQTQAPAPAAITAPVVPPTKPPVSATVQQQLPASERPKPVARAPSAPVPMVEAKPTPPARSTTTPVSILKPTPPQSTSGSGPSQGPARPPVLSAIPKHLQPQISARSNAVTPPEQRMAPIAKMFVECCGCKFYHDMPSKLYECMAKPDAVVEDKLLGISGAITTMVKCPWCQHNMSTKCCAGYAAVVYVKEKLH